MDLYFSGMIIGIILLQTAIVAPTLFKNLDIKDFGKVIRALWPKFFILLSALGFCTLLALFLGDNPTHARYAIAGLTTLFGLICYAIIPATNRATDEGNQKIFNVLHRMSVWLTVAMLLLNLVYPFV